MQHIGKAIEKFLRKTGLEKGVVQQNALIVWKEVLGDTVSENATAEKIDHGILMVKVKTSTWRQELQLQKPTIIKKLNKKLGKKVIKDVRFG